MDIRESVTEYLELVSEIANCNRQLMDLENKKNSIEQQRRSLEVKLCERLHVNKMYVVGDVVVSRQDEGGSRFIIIHNTEIPK